MEKFRSSKWGLIVANFFASLVLVLNVLIVNVYANANYGEKAGKWFAEQAFWFGLIALIIVIIGCIMSRNWIRVVVSVLAGGAVLYLLSNPDKIKSIGETMFKLIE